MRGRLAGKKAIVTGGAMGIGFGIVRRFVAEGADVLIADLDGRAAEAAAAKAAGGPGRAVAVQADVAEDGAGARLVERVVREFGGLDVLVNNAGIFPQVPMVRMEPALFDKVYRVNLKGLAFVSQTAANRMIEQGGGGRIINIASIDAFHPSMVGLAAYDASKGGVVMFTKSLALELGPHKILVNGIAPGGIATEGTSRPLEGSGMSKEEMEKMLAAFTARIPLGRMGVPDDIAKVAVFLASEDADYITGETIVVDGGMLLS
ncbi:MAG: SDR family NAD(P)-dependent oxidoreductase [Patescibacteria group bacterium]